MSMNATRITKLGKGNVWLVEMRPQGRWFTPDGYAVAQVCTSYESAVAFVWAIMQDS